MTGIIRRVAPGYPVPAILCNCVELVQGASLTDTLPAGPGEFVGFALRDVTGTSAAFNDMKCKIVCDGVTIFDNFLYDLLMITTGNTTKGQFASHAKADAVRCTVSYAVMMAYESTFTIRFLNDNALTYWFLLTVYARRGA